MSKPGKPVATTVGQADQPPVDQLLTDIRSVIERARQQASAAVNAAQTYLYWHIGQRIHTELLGSERAPYGAQIVATLSRQLVLEYGRGFAEKNLRRMMQLAQAYPDEQIVVTLLRQLSWSHFLALLPLDKPYQRDFYAEMCRIEGWSVRTLRELETFLLELGSGFSFVARQKRIQLDGDDFYIDLLFYNRKLKRLVVVELKQGNFKPEYKGQMELYLRWLAKFETEVDENPPLGIILYAGKNSEQIELLELDASGIHVAEYLTVLPPRDVLHRKLHEAIETARTRIEANEGDAGQERTA